MKGYERLDSDQQTNLLTSDSETSSRYVEEEHSQLSLRQRRAGELHWSVFDYFPAAHYRLACDQRELETDGGTDNLHKGSRIAKVYYWLDPGTGAALAHTNAYDDEANPYFGTILEAERFLEQRAETGNRSERYETLSLYEAKTRKIRDAKDVLTEQAAFDDFLSMKDG